MKLPILFHIAIALRLWPKPAAKPCYLGSGNALINSSFRGVKTSLHVQSTKRRPVKDLGVRFYSFPKQAVVLVVLCYSGDTYMQALSPATGTWRLGGPAMGTRAVCSELHLRSCSRGVHAVGLSVGAGVSKACG